MNGLLDKLRGLFGGGQDTVFWAWGPGRFENDDAADWLWTYKDKGAACIEATLDEVLEGAQHGAIPLDAAHRALAAAEAVAYAFGRGTEGLDDEQTAAMAAHAEAVRHLPDIRQTTVRAIVAVLGQSPDGKRVESELALKWESAGSNKDFKTFLAALQDLALRVKG